MLCVDVRQMDQTSARQTKVIKKIVATVASQALRSVIQSNVQAVTSINILMALTVQSGNAEVNGARIAGSRANIENTVARRLRHRLRLDAELGKHARCRTPDTIR